MLRWNTIDCATTREGWRTDLLMLSAWNHMICNVFGLPVTWLYPLIQRSSQEHFYQNLPWVDPYFNCLLCLSYIDSKRLLMLPLPVANPESES
jgi:hypothetical protein